MGCAEGVVDGLVGSGDGGAGESTLQYRALFSATVGASRPVRLKHHLLCRDETAVQRHSTQAKGGATEPHFNNRLLQVNGECGVMV